MLGYAFEEKLKKMKPSAVNKTIKNWLTPEEETAGILIDTL